jgi:uracil-DNA glycosylase
MSATMQDASFDYALDERQRSMLEAMGIKLWLPDTAPQVLPESTPTPAPIQNLEQEEPIAGIKPAQTAPKSIVLPAVTPTAPAAAVASARPSGIEQMDWPSLQTAVSACQACALCQLRKNTVFGVGQSKPREPIGSSLAKRPVRMKTCRASLLSAKLASYWITCLLR